MMSEVLPCPDVEGGRKQGQHLWFEYHCNESHSSGDAQLWYRSHQRVEVLGATDCDGLTIHKQEDRFESACLMVYSVRFLRDGFVGSVFEDELLDSEAEYERPAPPAPLTGDPSNETV